MLCHRILVPFGAILRNDICELAQKALLYIYFSMGSTGNGCVALKPPTSHLGEKLVACFPLEA